MQLDKTMKYVMKIDKINADCVMNVSNARINITRRKKYSSVSFEFKDNKNFPGLNLKEMYFKPP